MASRAFLYPQSQLADDQLLVVLLLIFLFVFFSFVSFPVALELVLHLAERPKTVSALGEQGREVHLTWIFRTHCLPPTVAGATLRSGSLGLTCPRLCSQILVATPIP